MSSMSPDPPPLAEHVPTVDLAAATRHAQGMLAALGLPCLDPQTRDTPRRFATALAEMLGGRYVDPGSHLAVTFPPESPEPGLIIARRVPVVSVCEHHLLPFSGHATVAYLPAKGADIVGLSKLARLVQGYARRPQVQERLGEQIIAAITRELRSVGAACVIRAEHTCLTLRGARADGAEMITSHLTGVLRDDPAVRAEFLALAG